MSDSKPTPSALLALALLALALALLACGSPAEEPPPCEAYEVTIDPALAPAWQNAAHLAIDAWAAEVPTFHPDATSSTCRIAFVARPEDGAHTGEVDGFTPNARPRAVVVPLDTRETDEELQRATALHEVGHVLGLEHDTTHGLDTIMFPYLERAPRIHPIDRERACAIWACR